MVANKNKDVSVKDKKVAVKLLKLAKKISKEQRQLSKVIGESEFLYEKVDEVDDIILDLLGIEDDVRGAYRDEYYILMCDYTLDLNDKLAEEVIEEIIKIENKRKQNK